MQGREVKKYIRRSQPSDVWLEHKPDENVEEGIDTYSLFTYWSLINNMILNLFTLTNIFSSRNSIAA